MVHDLKTIQPYFDDIRSGRKKFELRKNDRNYSTGDFLNLWEYIPSEKRKTGEVYTVRIIYILDKFQDALKDGWCILGIEMYDVPF